MWLLAVAPTLYSYQAYPHTHTHIRYIILYCACYNLKSRQSTTSSSLLALLAHASQIFFALVKSIVRYYICFRLNFCMMAEEDNGVAEINEKCISTRKSPYYRLALHVIGTSIAFAVKNKIPIVPELILSAFVCYLYVRR